MEGQHSSVVVLRRADFEPDDTGLEVDLRPPEGKDLADAPAGQVSELGDGQGNVIRGLIPGSTAIRTGRSFRIAYSELLP